MESNQNHEEPVGAFTNEQMLKVSLITWYLICVEYFIFFFCYNIVFARLLLVTNKLLIQIFWRALSQFSIYKVYLFLEAFHLSLGLGFKCILFLLH